MKRPGKLVALVLAAVFAAALFTGCSISGEQVKIGLSLGTLKEERWVRDRDKMIALAKEDGAELLVQCANLDASSQISQCDSLISQGIKVLILAPHDAEGAAAIVERAHKAGVKVISYDRLVLNCEPEIYLSFDNVKVGEIQGKYLTEKVPKGNIVFLSGAPTDNNTRLLKQGAAKYIQAKVASGDYRIVMEQGIKDWKAEEAMKLMEQALAASNNDIQGVLAPNDGTAEGCIQALAARGLAGKVPITGQDSELAAARRIIEGTQSMTVFKDTRALAIAAMDAAMKLAKGESLDKEATQKVNNNKIDVPSILLTPIAIDKSNLDKELIESGYLKKEDVYGG